MEQYNRNNEAIDTLLNLDFIPLIPEREKGLPEYTKFPISELSALGVAFSSLPETFRTVTQTMDTEGLYRCVFPEGVSGKLATFKDGSGNLGTIMNENGIAGQARWMKADVVTTTATVPYNPTLLFMAMALLTIDKKLDQIQDGQKEILRFLEQDKESQMKGDLDILTEILNHYKYNWDSELFRNNKYDLVAQIRRTAAGNVDFYRKEIGGSMPKKSVFHLSRNTDSLLQKLDSLFRNYQLSLYLYAFSYFLEVLLLENFSEDYLYCVTTELERRSQDYRMLYSDCYGQMEHFAKSAVESQFLKGVAVSSRFAGDAIARIPLVSKSQIDETLYATGDYLGNLCEKQTEKTMETYIANRDTSIQVFIDQLHTLNQLHNQPVEMLMDQKNVYLKLVE